MKIILLFLVFAVSSSCSKEDSEQEKLLIGEWYLSEADCFCAIESTRNLEENTLRFNPDKNILYLYNPPENPAYIAETGSYQYFIDEDIIIINDMSYRFEIKKSALILTYVDEPEIADDELILRYNRE